MGRFVLILVCASAALVIPASAEAAGPLIPSWAAPFQIDPEKPMCVGVQTTIWGDGDGHYTGPCRYGAPLGPMQAAIKQMDRRVAVGRAREGGLADRFADRLNTELSTIAGIPVITGQNRLKRYARSQTLAATDQGQQGGQQGQPAAQGSWLKRSIVNCALFGAVAGTVENLWNSGVKHRKPNADTAKAMAINCALAVISPPLYKWIKSKGYNLDD